MMLWVSFASESLDDTLLRHVIPAIVVLLLSLVGRGICRFLRVTRYYWYTHIGRSALPTNK